MVDRDIKRVGTRRQVYFGKAKQTSGGLKRADLALSKDGRVVSKKKQARAKGTKNNLNAYLKIKKDTKKNAR